MWIGIDIGGTKTAVVLSSEPPVVAARIEFPTLPAEGPDRAIQLIRQEVRRLLVERGVDAGAIQGIGVSCGGPLDRVTGIIQSPPNLPTWVDVPIKNILEAEFGAPCHVENDANAGAVAEHRYGAGRGTQNMVFLTMGTGLGGGIITDGRLYHGASDLAGEIGHVRLTRTGPVGHHKAGSAEGWVSGGGMAQVAERMVKASCRRGKATLLAECLAANHGITGRDIGMAAEKGDLLALRIIRATGRRLGEVLAVLIDILNPERIVIGGLAMRFGERVLAPARRVVRREALAASAAACEIVPAQLDEQIGDIAALCVATGL